MPEQTEPKTCNAKFWPTAEAITLEHDRPLAPNQREKADRHKPSYLLPLFGAYYRNPKVP